MRTTREIVRTSTYICCSGLVEKGAEIEVCYDGESQQG